MISTLFVFIFSLSVNAASSSFSWSGSLIDGRANGTYHKLGTGKVYLKVTSLLSGDPTVTLCRNTNWFEGWDETYGSVYVPKANKYVFPKKADASSDKYYLYVYGDALYSEATGTLTN